jgi:hypothetical protein
MNKFLLLLLLPACLFPCLLMAQTPVDSANITPVDTTGQKDLIDVIRPIFTVKPRKKEEAKDVYFSVLPLSSSVPGGSKALVTSTTAGFYLGDRKTTYLSSVTFAPYFNFNGRYGLPIHSSIWTNNNTLNIEGDTRFLVYPQYTWGLGGRHAEEEKLLVNYDYVRFYQSVLKRIRPYLYAGIGYNLDYYIDIYVNGPVPLSDFANYPYGTGQHTTSFSSGLTFNFLYDTRQNLFNPIPGAFTDIIYRFNSKVLGSDNNAQSIYVDMRKYISLSKDGRKNQLALWSYYWTTLSPGTAYLNLPSIGNDPYQRSGRGIEQNRYRGNGLIYFEGEYRRDVTRNGLLGFVLFANVNSVTEPEHYKFFYWNPAAGGGVRVKFNKKSNTNICIDYGFSHRYSNLTLALGEAF